MHAPSSSATQAKLPSLTALIDFANPHAADGAPRLRHAFGTPSRVLQAKQLTEVAGVLLAAEAAARAGAWCVGYVRYEAAPAFDAALAVHPATGPLAWFAVYTRALPWPEPPVPAPASPTVQWQPSLARSQFDAALAKLDAAIAAGEFYQVNYTSQRSGQLVDDAQTSTASAGLALFHALQQAQPGGYAAYLDAGHEQVLSVSPELFFDWRDGQLLTRPMKGTAPRGATPHDDATQAEMLRNSPKERAENVMIVDLLRNDVSRIAEPFSVQVPQLFHTQALPSVWQMTSDVTARTRAGCTLADVFEALFPCGSITGAPKVQAMQAIRALEPEARGVYCGAVGVLQPGGIATFNVPIRTLTLQSHSGEPNSKTQQVRYGIGSGITSGSEPAAEWAEWQHKQAFVQRATTRFELLETLGLVDGQLMHRSLHLARMQAAATHFGFAWPALALEQALAHIAQAHSTGAWRVRLLLNSQGQATAQAFELPPSPSTVLLQLAKQPLEEAHSEFVRFKTTHRPHYDAFTPTAPGVFDTLLWNTQQEITECTRGNIALLLRGQWVTPPLRCGLLPGVGRAQALADGRLVEAVVTVRELPEVSALAFVNSMRGWLPATLVP